MGHVARYTESGNSSGIAIDNISVNSSSCSAPTVSSSSLSASPDNTSAVLNWISGMNRIVYVNIDGSNPNPPDAHPDLEINITGR